MIGCGHMSQPQVPGHGMGEEPARDPGLPGGGLPGPTGAVRAEDLRLGDFAEGGEGDACLPGPGLVATLDALSGPQWRCDGATDEELVGLLGRWAAAESWAAAAKLGVARELLRRRAVPLPGTVGPGGLPEVWDEGTGHEAAMALGISVPAADKLLILAWTLEARLPGTGASLAGGTIDVLKAKIIADELSVLDDAQAAAAEQLILDQLAGKTPGQIGKLAAAAAAAVDPEGTTKRREQAEKDDARVRFWRERTGTSALAAYGLPTDAALSANANISQRAGTYKKSGAFSDTTMDQLRVMAFLDIINDITADGRIAQARADRPQAPADSQPTDDRPADGFPVDAAPVGDGQSDYGAAGNDPGSSDASGGPGNSSPSGSGPGNAPGTGNGPEAGNGGTGQSSGAGPALAARSNLTLPLATLLGLAERPGAGHGLGPLDPALVRDLGAAAARNPHSEWCVTITDADGYAIGHGCCRMARAKRAKFASANGRDGPWTFTRQDDPGPPDGYGTWNLTFPDGRQFTVKLGAIPVTSCDHRHESHAYEPSGTLRHLIEIRDGECTFPSCSRHARNCDFEHAIPYDKGGRTCGCNAGARSRRCHKVKQSKGWKVTQPRPGWHEWTTPSGRTYTQGPMRYPA